MKVGKSGKSEKAENAVTVYLTIPDMTIRITLKTAIRPIRDPTQSNPRMNPIHV